MFENKKILVLGMAKSGYNIAKLLASKNEIIVTDQKDQDEKLISELASLNVKFIKSDKQEELLDKSFDYLIKNPGVMPFAPAITKAHELKIPVLNEMEVAYHFLPKDTFIIGITGSNGKTTTTTIVYEILKKIGKDVILGGNIGYPLSEILNKVKKGSILILEISDHQLINFKDFKTNISVLTNICPTHLDYHGSYEAYKKVKKNIFLNHKDNDLNILNNHNQDSLNLCQDIKGNTIYFNDDKNYVNDEGIYINNDLVISLNDIKLKGNHNYENIMAALLVINYFGLDKKAIKEFLSAFNGVEHRMEFVLEKGGVKYYNDSKATNPTSTVTALKAFSGNVHLLLGGMERNQDFHELDSVINKCKYIYALGQTADKVMAYAKEKGIPAYKCDTIKNAVSKLKTMVSSGDIVLLSPASASWDQYARFEDRGDEFKDLVKC